MRQEAKLAFKNSTGNYSVVLITEVGQRTQCFCGEKQTNTLLKVYFNDI